MTQRGAVKCWEMMRCFNWRSTFKDGVLTVDPNPITAWMFANCVLVENAQGVKPEKRSSALKIDGVIAMLMAVRGLTRLPR